MSWPLFAAGLAINAIGNWMGNQAQAAAEEQNAQFYETQAQFAQAAGDRQKKLAAEESTYGFGQAVGTIAKAGVDITAGSPLSVMANMRASALDTQSAIDYKTTLDTQLARARGQQARDVAHNLRSPLGFLLQTSGHAMTAYSQFKG
jgi:uncharacterized protein YidB (DUF937 family)